MVNIPGDIEENETLVFRFESSLMSIFSLVGHSDQQIVDKWIGFGFLEVADEGAKSVFLVSIV